MPEQPTPLATRLEQALSAHYRQPVAVSGLVRFHGGAARETYRFDATHGGRRHGLVARLDPPASLIDTSRRVEYHAIGRAHAAGLPVPEPLLLDADGTQLGAPGFIMHEVPGGHAGALGQALPYGSDSAAAGRQLFAALGRLHAIVPDAADRAILADHGAAARLAHWAGEIRAHQIRAEPIVMAAIRWLEANLPPPSGPPAIVHGDFRSGNFLVDDANQLLVILDWELAHLGDPYDDLAWVLDPFWSHGTPERAAGLLPRADAIRAWEAASGRHFDAELFRWWQMFAGVQGLAIWITSAEIARSGKSFDPVNSFASIVAYRFHNLQVASMLKAYLP